MDSTSLMCSLSTLSAKRALRTHDEAGGASLWQGRAGAGIPPLGRSSPPYWIWNSVGWEWGRPQRRKWWVMGGGRGKARRGSRVSARVPHGEGGTSRGSPPWEHSSFLLYRELWWEKGSDQKLKVKCKYLSWLSNEGTKATPFKGNKAKLKWLINYSENTTEMYVSTKQVVLIPGDPLRWWFYVNYHWLWDPHPSTEEGSSRKSCAVAEPTHRLSFRGPLCYERKQFQTGGCILKFTDACSLDSLQIREVMQRLTKT